MDPVFEFEKRRNEPVKHSQELMQKTSRLRKIVNLITFVCGVFCVSGLSLWIMRYALSGPFSPFSLCLSDSHLIILF